MTPTTDRATDTILPTGPTLDNFALRSGVASFPRSRLHGMRSAEPAAVNNGRKSGRGRILGRRGDGG